MRIAAISDVHGNIAALEAVLSDIDVREVDLIVNLGDIVSGPLAPAATAEALMRLGLPTIRGNHERELLSDAASGWDRFARETMNTAQLAWLAALPATLRLPGNPASDLVYLMQTVQPGGLRPATPREIEQRLTPERAEVRLCLCGHSHTQMATRLEDGALVVNPGSVGLQAFAWDQPHPHVIEGDGPEARYAIVEGEGDHWEAQLLKVAYPWEEAARLAQRNGAPDWAVRLRTGRLETTSP